MAHPRLLAMCGKCFAGPWSDARQSCIVTWDFTPACNWEYWPLFLVLFSFLAATLIPLSSEASLIAALACGQDVWTSVIASSIGNCLASLLNYAIGYYGGRPLLRRMVATRRGRAAFRVLKRRGYPGLALTLLPAIGDPINIMAGFFRMKLVPYVVIVFALRILRYVLIALGWL